MAKLNIIVVGTGMYVCGRGTEDYGTVMPAVFEWSKDNAVGEVFIAGNSVKGVESAKTKIRQLRRKMNLDLEVKYLPQGKDNPDCYKEAIRKISKPACAIVAVPDNLHKEIAVAAIKEGVHTLVVKPLVPTVKEAKELIALQEEKGVYCAVEFHKRFDDANMKLKDTIAQGLIGDPLYFLAEFSQRKNIPSKQFKRWVRTTNIFQYLGIHYVDIIYFATKARPIRAMAVGQKNWLKSKGVDVYDAIEATIEWKSPSGKRFSSHIVTNWVDPESTSAMSDQKIKVIGTRGRFESDQKKRGIMIVTDEKGIEEPNPYFCSSYESKDGVFYRGYGIESICQFLEDVCRIENKRLKIKELEELRPTFRDSVVSVSVLEAVNKSLDLGGRWVDIPEPIRR